MDLFQKSIAVLTLYQHRSGAFPAAPFFPVYQYTWLRDGTFCAYALDQVQRHDNSRGFYRWVNSTLQKNLPKLVLLEEKLKQNSFNDDDFLHTRFTLQGEESGEPWGNFQLDGYGTYLWGITQHVKLVGTESIMHESSEVIQEVAFYLQRIWQTKCLDCWEENKNIHPSTLACIYGGLKSLQDFSPELVDDAVLNQIKNYVIKNFSANGHFVKIAGSAEIDSNLLWLAVPFGLIDLKDPLFQQTVAKINFQLRKNGLYRYLGDSYYGGGEWLLLTAWLGWCYALTGKTEEARKILQWIEEQVDEYGQLPEQVSDYVQFPDKLQEWRERWGEAAKPLLWSHAMHIILCRALGK